MNAPIVVALDITLREPLVDRVQIALRLGHRDAGFQSRHNCDEPVEACFVRSIERKPVPDFCIIGIVEAGGHDADDRRHMAVESYLPVHYIRGPAETSLPQTVTDHYDPR